ncbi:MAG: hypothetical protein K5905_18625 [Roseibium sp.]|uniref:hypothetical protein n=1 Tax=Roseibium sp. TaxID=1936156 RepID=UPI0026148353|nr:hypothetical protein [Roseibium sp.]MCV0427478.1 hypothetical protein [Roseibium sp.]
MSVQKILYAAGVLAMSCTTSLAGSNFPLPGDTYIISRDSNRVFRGSHRIYNRMSDGLVEVEYCGRAYWVRYATIAWTQLEVEQNYAVRVEFNWGKGWRPICNHPEEQVTLKGLGITEDPRVIVQNDGASVKRVNRFAAIRESFRPESGDNAAASFHSK